VTTKRELRARIAELERRELEKPPLTFRTLTVCFATRTVELDGRTIGPIEANCVALPILGGERVLIPRRGGVEILG